MISNNFIVSIESEVKQIKLKTPFITALRRVEDVEFVRLHVKCDDGSFAIGEAPATKVITGEGIDDILVSVDEVKNSLIGKTPVEALDVLHVNSEIRSSAKAALDMSLVTLLAKSENQELYIYLGAKNSATLQTDVTISLNTPQIMLEDAKEAVDNNMSILKLKFGRDISDAIEVIKKVSYELPEAKLLVDANQAWSVDESLSFIDGVEGCDIELIEQPVVAKDLSGLKKITDMSTTPILADEAVFTLYDAKKVIETKSANMINIKLMKCGGITKAVEILDFAREKNVTCMLGSMLEGPYSINAALHLAMAYRDVIKYIDLDSPLLYKEPSDELEFEFNGSEISLKS